MNIKSLALKNKLVEESTGEFYYDLTAPSFIYDSDLGVRALHYVQPDQVGRMDKMCIGSSFNIKVICKWIIIDGFVNSSQNSSSTRC